MTRSERMKPITQVAGSRERDAARVLGESQRRLAEVETKLNELTAYRDEYVARLKREGGNGMASRSVLDYQIFLSRLNEAIAYQHGRVSQARREVEQKRALWQASRTQSMALDKVVERYQGDERRAAERREQKELDDRSQRATSLPGDESGD